MSEENLDLRAIELELEGFPTSVLHEYGEARRSLERDLAPAELLAWATEGLALARHSFRSWQAATEFFRASPEVARKLGSPSSLVYWARVGQTLTDDSSTLATTFFQATPAVLERLSWQELVEWSRLSKGLYKGNWKSGTLASTFLELSPRLLSHLSMEELKQLARFVDTLAQNSYELATECLTSSEQVFPQLDREDRRDFLRLAAALVDHNWRDIRTLLDNGPKVVGRIYRDQRARFLALAEKLARLHPSSALPFLLEGSSALQEVSFSDHSAALSQAEGISGVAPGAVVEFLRSLPRVLTQIKADQLGSWVQEGLGTFQENEEGGIAYFRLESARCAKALDSLSCGIELEKVQGVLGMYCQALGGRTIQLLTTETLKDKGIGWTTVESPSTEGRAIYLPAFVGRYGSKDMNFHWCKVVVTHQVGHLEFGSFEFSFEKEAHLFPNLRWDRQAQAGNDTATTDLERFFDLFPDRKLASDIFMLTEDGRVDFLVQSDYSGISKAYRRVQQEAVAEQPSPDSLPLREAMVEVLMRVSLQDTSSFSTPKEIQPFIEAIARIAKTVQQLQATVEDSAEATLSLYDLISQIPNLVPPEEQSQGTESNDDSSEMSGFSSQEELQEFLKQLLSQGGVQSLQQLMASLGEEQPYESPPQVEYRGDFKPELVQLLSELRKQQEASPSAEEQQANAEALQNLLEKSVEVAPREPVSGEVQATDQLVNRLLTEVSRKQPQGGFSGQFRHVDDDSGPLSSTEPMTYLYDEWDFRAMDYKPKWCCVKERYMEEGSPDYFDRTLASYSMLVSQIKREFEMLQPEAFRKVKRLTDGEDIDFDLVVESLVQRRVGGSPSEKVYWARNKVERDVAMAFLLDISASTAEAIDEGRTSTERWDLPDDPRDYMAWLHSRREEFGRRSYKRIIDIEKESAVLLTQALETLGDRYALFGFSGYGRENVEFYVIKDLEEPLSRDVKARLDKVAPRHATRMGPAVRHAISKLEKVEAKTKILFLLSDGRPQDRGYSREGVEKEYAMHDTRMALLEAKRKQIIPFCLTVDRAGHDYLKTMCSDMGYEVLSDVRMLPQRLLYLYRRLTA